MNKYLHTLSYTLSDPAAWSNLLILAGFTGIAVGAGLVYLPAGLITGGMLAVVLAKLIQQGSTRES